MVKSKQKLEERFAFQAEEEGNARLAQLFRHANRVIQERGETMPVDLFTHYEVLTRGEKDLQEERLEDLENLEEVDYYVCSVCGFVSDHKPQEKCGRCQADPSEAFRTA
jgi:rubrerythrin